MPLNLIKDPAGRPATDISALRGDHPDLAKRADKAAVSLSKRNLSGIRAQALLYVDHSGSMRGDYAAGRVQTLVERALGFALTIDADGKIPVIPWDTRLHPPVTVTAYTYRGIVNQSVWHPGSMGRTRLDLVLSDIEHRAQHTDTPLFAVIVTDGNPDDKRAATRLVRDLAAYPAFIKFLALREVPYLDELDDLPSSARLLDNVDTKRFPDPDNGIPDLAQVTDLAFADAMVDEWDTWIDAARAAGVIA